MEVTEQVNSKDVQTTTTTTVDSHPLPSWKEIYAGINNGAWAVVLVALVLFVLTKRSMKQALLFTKTYLEHQSQTTDQLAATVKSNSETLKVTSETLAKMSTNDEKVALALHEMSARQDRVEDVIDELTKALPAIVARQEKQLSIAKAIARRLFLNVLD